MAHIPIAQRQNHARSPSGPTAASSTKGLIHELMRKGMAGTKEKKTRVRREERSAMMTSTGGSACVLSKKTNA